MNNRKVSIASAVLLVLMVVGAGIGITLQDREPPMTQAEIDEMRERVEAAEKQDSYHETAKQVCIRQYAGFVIKIIGGIDVRAIEDNKLLVRLQNGDGEIRNCVTNASGSHVISHNG